MIREILPDCGGQVHEVARSMYKMWHCYDCGLEFSMKTMERPVLCPRCMITFNYETTDHDDRAFGTHLREAYGVIKLMFRRS